MERPSVCVLAKTKACGQRLLRRLSDTVQDNTKTKLNEKGLELDPTNTG